MIAPAGASASSSESTHEWTQGSGSESSSEETTNTDSTFRKGRNGPWLTAGIIVADVVGAGILGMPAAVAKFGWALGAVAMTVMLAANVHISILLWRVLVGCETCVGAQALVDLAAGAFAKAPLWQRRAAVWVTGISQFSFIFGLLGLYLLSAGKGLGMTFFGDTVCLPFWAARAGALLLPFAATAREMGSWQSLVWINILTLVGTVFIPLGYYTIAGTDGVRPANSPTYAVSTLTPPGVLSALSTFTFGMTSQFMLTEIISEMKDRSELPKAYAHISAPFQLVCFLLAGLGGYMFIGDKSAGMINENLPFNPVFRVAALCLVTHMLISYLIKGIVWCKAVHRLVDREHSDSQNNSIRSWLGWDSVVVVTLLAAWFLANVVPFFGDAVDLLGASFTPLSCWVMPILFFVRWYYDAGKDRPHVSMLEWAALFCEFTLASILMVLGTYSAMYNILGHWHTYGYPFECHCEGMWNTCQCSADHVGMDMCDAVAGR